MTLSKKPLPMIKALLLDLDDTLFAEIDYAHSGFNHVARVIADTYSLDCQTLVARMKSLEQTSGRGRIFNETLDAFEIDYTPDDIRHLVTRYRNHKPTISLYPGVRDCLEKLSTAYPLFLVTNGLPLMQRSKVEALNLSPYFQEIIYCDNLAPKPSPLAFFHVMEDYKFSPSTIIMIGDNPATDEAAAVAAGTKFIRIHTERFAATKSAAKTYESFKDFTEDFLKD